MNPYKSGRAQEYKYNDTDSIPNEMGTYRFLSKKRRDKLYIGISVDLKRRVKQHKKKGTKLRKGEIIAIKIAKKDATYEEICEHERNKIKKHNPKRNKRAGGAGRRPILDVDTHTE